MIDLARPRLPVHRPGPLEPRSRRPGSQHGLDLREEPRRGPPDGHQAIELFDFRDGAGNHRQPGRHILPQLEGVRGIGEVVDDERQDGDVEPLAVSRQELIVLATEQMNVRQALQPANIRLRAADQREGPLGTGHREEPNQLQVHPIGDQSEESDQGTRQGGQLRRHHRVRAAGASEVLHIHAVRHQERRSVVASLALVQQLR